MCHLHSANVRAQSKSSRQSSSVQQSSYIIKVSTKCFTRSNESVCPIGSTLIYTVESTERHPLQLPAIESAVCANQVIGCVVGSLSCQPVVFPVICAHTQSGLQRRAHAGHLNIHLVFLPKKRLFRCLSAHSPENLLIFSLDFIANFWNSLCSVELSRKRPFNDFVRFFFS